MTVQEIQEIQVEIKKEEFTQGEDEKIVDGKGDHVIIHADQGELLNNKSESRNGKATRMSLFLNEVAMADDEVNTLSRRYTLFSTLDSYTNLKLLDEVDFVFGDSTWLCKDLKTSIEKQF